MMLLINARDHYHLLLPIIFDPVIDNSKLHYGGASLDE